MLEQPPEAKKPLTGLKPVHKTSVVYSTFVVTSIALVMAAVVLFHSIISAPKRFPAPSVLRFSTQDTLVDLTSDLYSRGYINSPFIFKVFIKLSGQESSIKAGNYYFDKKLNVSQLAHRFVTGDTREISIRLTIPEGFTVKQTSDLVALKFENISADNFKKLAQNDEGYLFPDTYFFDTDVSVENILEKLKANYLQKTNSFFSKLDISKKQERDIIILASLLEEEGKTLEDKKIIAGILLNRLEKRMPLQVDATINYIKGRADRVYFSDLEIDSPYNTYQNKGLPPGPISSPGLESIQAATSPMPSKYFYYLTGADGTFHYAKTFEEHVRNKEKYLR